MEIFTQQTIGIWWEFRLCHDTGSACYSCQEFGINKLQKATKFEKIVDKRRE